MEFPPSFGLWLKERRKQLDLTQVDLANRVGCSVMTIRKIEADERRPSRQIAELLADCMEIAPADRPAFLKVARAELRADYLFQNVRMSSLNSAPDHRLPASLQTRPAPKIPYGQGAFGSGQNEASPPQSSFGLPIPLTPLVGREHELAHLTELLQNPQCHLLTLIGPGGIGKTRLAVEAAAHQHHSFADGVYFVSLAAVSSPELIIPTVASALGFTFYGPADLLAQLLNYLREKSILLVLDNFEQLLPSAWVENEAGLELLLNILQAAPAVKLLVTSRERLHLHQEWVFEVQGLPVPPLVQTDGLEAYSAVALFLQNARRTLASFVLTPAEQTAIARICQLMEGLPLGLELAATWVRVLSCQEIVQEIERGLDFLAASARDLPERQRSLRLTFDHSWKLLSSEEQQVMRRLSVFRGGFRREAAERVAGATLPVLSALVDKSLLRRMGEGRYDLHELVRQYAATHLRQMTLEEHTTREHHSDFFAGLLQQLEPRLKNAEQSAAVAELDADVDNLRLAWDWIVAQRDVARLQQGAQALFIFCLCHNWLQEGAELMERTVEAIQATVDSLPAPPVELLTTLGRVLAYQGWCRLWGGQPALARELVARDMALLRPLQAPVALSDALLVQGVLLQMTGDLVAARASLEEGLAIKRALNDEWEVGLSLTYLGRFVQTQGGHAEAYDLLAEAAAIFRRRGDRVSTARALGFLGASALALGQPKKAEQLTQESLAISREINDHWNIANVLTELGLIAQVQANAAGSLSFFCESVALYRQVGDRWSMTRVLNYQGETLNRLGQPVEARRCFLEALQMTVEAQVTPVALDALLGLITLNWQEGADEPALEWVIHLLRHPAASPETKNRAEKLHADLELQLTPQQVAAVQARAQARSFTLVVQDILNSAAMP